MRMLRQLSVALEVTLVAAVMFVAMAVLPAGAAQKELMYGFKESFAEIHGVGDFHYIDAEKDANFDYSDKGTRTFALHTFHLLVKSMIAEDVDIIADVEFEKGLSTPKGDRCEFNWRLADPFIFSFGKFYMPIGIEVYHHLASANQFVTRSFGYTNVIPGTYSDYGTSVHGYVPVKGMGLDYRVAMVNGLQDSAATKIRDARPDANAVSANKMVDNNEDKMIVALLRFYPVKDLDVGGSFASGKYDIAEKFAIDYYTGHAAYNNGRIYGESQYTISHVDTAVGQFSRSAWYALGAYKVLRNLNKCYYLEPCVMYDTIDPDSRVDDNNDQSRWIAGLNYSPREHLLFKLNWEMVSERYGNNLDNNVFRIQGVIDF